MWSAAAPAMAWLEQCDVCGGVGFLCCHRNNPDLNQAAPAACPYEGVVPGSLQEFQFFGRPAGGGIGWLVDDPKDGEVASEDRGPPPVVPAAWSSDSRRGSCSPARWPPTLDSCSASASSKSLLAEASGVGPATSAGATDRRRSLSQRSNICYTPEVPYFGGADASIADAMEADKTASSGKDDSSSMDREARVLRYREKKKRRKFGKQIRYASRKAYAEARPRIRGRFVKAPEGMTQPPPALPPHYDVEQVDMGWFRAFRP